MWAASSLATTKGNCGNADERFLSQESSDGGQKWCNPWTFVLYFKRLDLSEVIWKHVSLNIGDRLVVRSAYYTYNPRELKQPSAESWAAPGHGRKRESSVVIHLEGRTGVSFQISRAKTFSLCGHNYDAMLSRHRMPYAV